MHPSDSIEVAYKIFTLIPDSRSIMDLDYSSMSRYVSPINPAVFPHLSIVLLGIGLFFTAWFFVYEVSISH